MPGAKTLTPRAFIKSATAKSFGGAYLLYGEDEYIKAETARRAVEAHVPAAERAFAVTHLTAGQTDAAEVLAAAEAVPLLGDRTAVVLHDAARLAAAHKTRLTSAFDRLSAPALLLLVGPDELDRRTKFYKWFADAGRAVACHSLTEAQAEAYAANCFKEQGRSINADGLALLMTLVGPDAGRLAQEARKLSLYAESGRAITRDDVAVVAGQSRGFELEHLVEAALAGDAAVALSTARGLVAGGQDPAALLGRLVMHYFDLYRALGAGTTQPWKLAGTLRIPTVRAEQLLGWARSTDAARVAGALRHLADAERLIKSGRAEPVLVFDSLTLALAGSNQATFAA
jgi:DNA polymerase-3 subunit delta